MTRLEKLEASHIKLMTEHEVFLAEQERAWQRNDREWARHQEWLTRFEKQREQDRERNVELDKRISDLVRGIGEFMRQRP
jgi:hypothetical protein